MDIRRIRAQMQMGRSIFDLPLRVTFYARVSTDQDEQLNSLENQIQYYTELIQTKKNWTFVPGYIDEGISGTSTRKRDDFNRMIRDAKTGLFDFIITKEISRFSRSTLDSIQYTQELLEHNVGVLFQNDHINTLDTDSEFRLVIMAGVAQDEVRKLSERLKFGFRQAIKNGHVLGNDRLYGYDKKDCILTINEAEAQIVRIIFDLYGNKRLGMRSISKELEKMGYTSREGNLFNTLTIRHMLENPKYKGWYCGNKTQTMDYRTKRKVFLDESEWDMYPDPSIPAIVSEALWDRANTLYKDRRREVMEHGSGASYQNRYPYSTKIICQAHGTTFHRQVLVNRHGAVEAWQCKVYRQKGRAACAAPQIRSFELDKLLGEIMKQLIKDEHALVESLMGVITGVSQGADYRKICDRLEEQIRQMHMKKDKLLDLSVAGALATAEFKQRNDALNDQIRRYEAHLKEVCDQEAKYGAGVLDEGEIRRALEQELRFDGPINSALVASILEKVVVKKESTKQEIYLDIYLKLGQQFEAVYTPEKSSASIIRLRSTTPKQPTRRT